jgi:hypothetical protein
LIDLGHHEEPLHSRVIRSVQKVASVKFPPLDKSCERLSLKRTLKNDLLDGEFVAVLADERSDAGQWESTSTALRTEEPVGLKLSTRPCPIGTHRHRTSVDGECLF